MRSIDKNDELDKLISLINEVKPAQNKDNEFDMSDNDESISNSKITK
ncbi:MAG: hypothetical protein AB7U98_05175 [Candidatus Nitrosocosmicus sp.]|jgi:hypothetical protein